MSSQSIEEYLPFVKMLAGKYRNYGVPFEDLVQEGLLGLWEAMQRFDPDRGTKLTTYAAYWIKKRMITAIQKENKDNMGSSQLIAEITSGDEGSSEDAIPERLNLPQSMPDNEKTVLTLSFEKQLTLNEIGIELGITREKARQIKEKGLRRLKSLLVDSR